MSRILSLLTLPVRGIKRPTPLLVFLRPLPITRRPWSHIALDFITGQPLLTMVDCFSKAGHFIALPKLHAALEMVKLLTDHVFRLHSIPQDTVSDWGPQVAGLEGVLHRAGSPSESILRVLSLHQQAGGEGQSEVGVHSPLCGFIKAVPLPLT